MYETWIAEGSCRTCRWRTAELGVHYLRKLTPAHIFLHFLRHATRPPNELPLKANYLLSQCAGGRSGLSKRKKNKEKFANQWLRQDMRSPATPTPPILLLRRQHASPRNFVNSFRFHVNILFCCIFFFHFSCLLPETKRERARRQQRHRKLV